MTGNILEYILPVYQGDFVVTTDVATWKAEANCSSSLLCVVDSRELCSAHSLNASDNFQ